MTTFVNQQQDNHKLCPFVLWAQDDEKLFLTFEIRNVSTQPVIDLSNEKLIFEAVGEGQRGSNLYGTTLNLFHPVDPKTSVTKITENRIEISCKKKQANDWWPRLLLEKKKPTWLKIDFDKWKDPDAETSEEELSADSLRERQANEFAQHLLKDYGQNEPDLPFLNWDLKTPYLLTYNGAMFLGYLFIVLELVYGYSTQGAGRFFILFVILGSETRLQDKPFVFYLFMTWSLIEIFRYPYYFLAVKGKSFYVVTWLRYNMWIPLYPLGAFIEAVIMLRSFPYFDETGKHSLTLPNAWNISFHFSLFLKVFLLVIFCPGVIYLLRHMRKQRVLKLSKTKVESKKKFK